MVTALVAAIGFLVGLAAHDLAIQGLTRDRALRPMVGTCPNCGNRRGWLSWRCPRCGRRLAREPLVAVTSALVAVGLANTVGYGWLLLPYLGFLLLSLALLVTDLEEFRIVDRLNIRGTIVLAVLLAVVALAQGDQGQLLRSLGGAVAYFSGALALYAVTRGRGFGGGDVKLATQLGLFTAYVSWGTLGWAVFATAMVGGVLAISMVLLGGARKDTEIPYGPAMIIGAWLALILAGVGAFPVPT